ncbi:MAG: hypothetical protein E7624_01475 [Ruminococcaceae bacterium]|nr:hypothetical protein [Oscillospiraceae bacterium]
MITLDWIVLGVGLALLLFGGMRGFGKVLKGIVSGFVGKLSAGAIAYFLYGVVLDWPIVQRLTTLLVDKLSANGNWICKLLLAIRIDMIVLAAALFLLVFWLIKLLAAILAGIAELPLLGLVNHLCGALLLLAYACVWALVIFQLSAWIFGTQGGLYPFLEGSKIGLQYVYLHNPLNSIFETIKHSLGALGG